MSDPDLLVLAESDYRAHLVEQAHDPGSVTSGFYYGRAAGYFSAAVYAMPVAQRWRMDFRKWRALIERDAEREGSAA